MPPMTNRSSMPNKTRDRAINWRSIRLYPCKQPSVPVGLGTLIKQENELSRRNEDTDVDAEHSFRNLVISQSCRTTEEWALRRLAVPLLHNVRETDVRGRSIFRRLLDRGSNRTTVRNFLHEWDIEVGVSAADDESRTLAEKRPNSEPSWLREMRTLYDKMLSVASRVSFEESAHKYTFLPTNRPFDRSVTKVLETLFGTFDADLVTRKLVESKKWEKNALFHELAFDEYGNRRDNDTVRELIKRKWNDKRDRGTNLHRYIQAFSHDQGTDLNVTTKQQTNQEFATAETNNRQRYEKERSPLVSREDAKKESNVVSETSMETDATYSTRDPLCTSMGEEVRTGVDTPDAKMEVEPLRRTESESRDAEGGGSTKSKGGLSCKCPRPNAKRDEIATTTTTTTAHAIPTTTDEIVKAMYASMTSNSTADDESKTDQRNAIDRKATNANRDGPSINDDSSRVVYGFADSLLQETDVDAFELFNRRRNDDGWLLAASEYIVYDNDASLAGSIDAIYVPSFDRPDQVVLVDWKRCEIDYGTRYSPLQPGMRYEHRYTRPYPKGNYWKYMFQLNVYRNVLEKQLGVTVVAMFIVSFEDGARYPRVLFVPRNPDAELFVDDLRKAVRIDRARRASNDNE